MLLLNISAFYNLFFLFFSLAIMLWIMYAMINHDKVSTLNRKFILGRWQLKGKNESGEEWQFEYSFTPTQFTMLGDPHYEAQGEYKVVKEIEGLLILQLTNTTGDIEPDKMFLHIGVQRKLQILLIDGREYKRMS
jgi:hypothetical protein